MENSLFAALFDEDERKPITVSQLNEEARKVVERVFPFVWVEGELNNFTVAASGHWYFTLHDGQSQVRATCWKTSNFRIRFKPFDGLRIRVKGRLSIYEPRGEFQIIVDALEPGGEGALAVAFEQVKEKLAAEGLFDKAMKRKLPRFPARVGVVTSPSGAAFFDVLHVLSRRARSISVTLIPTRVQGDEAGREIAAAIRTANLFSENAIDADKIDVLIVGRGGGSAESLWAFNEELVARAISQSKIPVISAVGHEIDDTIADLVADVRAATPSAAAEMVATAEEDILDRFRTIHRDLFRGIENRITKLRVDFHFAAASAALTRFSSKIGEKSEKIENLSARLSRSIELVRVLNTTKLARVEQRLSPRTLAAKTSEKIRRIDLLKQRFRAAEKALLQAKINQSTVAVGRLHALSPLAVLSRGFSIAEKDSGEIVRDPTQVTVGDVISVRLEKGKLKAKVLSSESQ